MSSPKIQSPQDKDVQISRENQNKINSFAIKNAWLEELNEELISKQNELKNLEDAEGDIMLIDDEEVTIPISIGECYIHYNQEKAVEKIQELMVKAKNDIKTLQSKITAIKTDMSNLKSELYSKFGESINLENDE